MDDDIEIADLFGTDSWDEIDARHAELVQEAESSVDRWLAAPVHADWEGPYLLWTVREGRAPYDEPLAKDPENWGRAVSYGLQQDGSVAVARRFQTIAGRPRLDLETIWVTRAGRPVQLWFHHSYYRSGHEAVVRRIAIRVFDDARQVGVKTWPDGRGGLDGGVEIESYTYVGDRITEIVSDRRSASRPQNDGRLRWPITYGADGGITRIEAHDEPPIEDIAPRVLYVRSDAAAARAAREAIEAAMSETIVAWARRVVPAGEVARALVIVYDLTNPAYPPGLALGVDGDHAAQRAAETGAVEDLLDLTELAVLDPTPAELMSDETSRELFAVLEHQWQEKDDTDGLPRLLLAVAKRMAAAEWADLLPNVSPDFIVIAVSLDRDEDLVEQSLRNSVPAPVRKRLLPPSS